MERLTLEQTLSILLQQIRDIRLKLKSNEDFDKVYVYIKSFFSMINVNFPIGPYKLKDKYDDKIMNIIYSFINELIILFFYMNYKPLGLKLSDIFIFNAPISINRNECISNQKFYLNPLKPNKTIKIKPVLNAGWYPFNPSIIKNNEGYLMSVRTINYLINEQGNYVLPENESIYKTVNHMLTLDKDLNILNCKEINDISTYQKYEGSRFQGIEDIILFQYNNEIWCSCTTLDTNPQRIPQISLCKFNSDQDIIEKIPLPSLNGGMQKNWLPFTVNGELKIIYGYSPFIILDYKNLQININIPMKYNLNFDSFKGSAAPINFDIETTKGYLFIVHETHNINGNLRCYLHRFIWMTLDFDIKRISHPWYLHHHGIEFCRSIQWSSNNEEIIIGYGIHDKEACLGIIDPEYLKGLLIDLEEFKIN